MQQTPADRRSTYLAALTQEIERKLQKALISPGQRPELLQKLFADVALEIDDRARDILLKKDENEIASADDGTENLCFYDVLADYYVEAPTSGKNILDLIVQLWSQSFVSHIFALLFHKWLFEASVETSEVLLRYGSALVQGASNYLLEEVALVPNRSNKISLQARRDLYLLLSRFLFFYNLGAVDDMLEPFLKHFPAYPNAFLVGGPEDIFVIELADQLQKLKVEPVLLHYLSRMGALKGLESRMATSTRLKACLYSFTSPGGPMYPTRAARHAAWDTLDLLFPVGRYPRHVISVFFRLLYPWYWPSSCWNFIVTCVTTVVYYILRVIISSWDNIRKSKHMSYNNPDL
ncbi:hypothetical protein MUK42_06376 [Musa troglodytarum]|uniref:Uncharacterized protein n=1 Tax=Musa troglodytarum TaxID=320322 RepID=A0A9E7HLN6_9LILI|nr:hypothetical protein MUK42_06376 [Musa troglodytarum]